MGGLARRATFIKAARARAGESHVLLLDGGNTFWGPSPSAATKKSQGKVIVEAMNQMGYDAMALGEGDLWLGRQIVRQRVADAHFPVLSANVRLPETHDEYRGRLLLDPYVLLEIGGRQVGIISAMGARGSLAAGYLLVEDPLEAIATHARELQAQTDIVIVLSQLDWDANVWLAEAVSGIDLILSAAGSDVLTERWQSPQTGTVVSQLGLYAREHPGWTVTLLQMTINGEGSVTAYSGSFVELGPEVADDLEIQQLLDKYQAN